MWQIDKTEFLEEDELSSCLPAFTAARYSDRHRYMDSEPLKKIIDI